LRSKLPARIVVTPEERRRLTKFATKLGGAFNCLATIVHPDTIRRWIREDRKSGKKPPRKGRPPTKEEIRTRILKLARENDGCGYTRIVGEPRKLGIKPPSRNTIQRILLENGFDPASKLGEGTWMIS
jgi:putative transposase